MKKTLAILMVVAAVTCLSFTLGAYEQPLKRTGATMHQIISPLPGSVDVVTPYNSAVTLHRLKKNEVAYWLPEGGKYITAGPYAYLWCRVYSKKSGKSKYHWIAVTSDAMNKALNLTHQYQDGVALYQLSNDGRQIAFKAYPYSTLHAIAEGKKVIDVKE